MKEYLSTINELFNSLLNRTIFLTLETSPKDVEGWDSMFQAQLIEAIERKFDIKFKFREILSWEKVGDIINSLNSHLC